MHSFQLVDAATQDVIVPQLAIADTFWSRFRGLQFRHELPANEGLLITKCSSIHTCWMRFGIDVIMLDAEGTVLHVRSNLRPWRLYVGPSGSKTVVELPAEAATVSEGQRLLVRPPRDVRVPPALSSMTADTQNFRNFSDR